MNEPKEKGKPRGRKGGRKAIPAEDRRQRFQIMIRPDIRKWITGQGIAASKLIEAAILEKYGDEIAELSEPSESIPALEV